MGKFDRAKIAIGDSQVSIEVDGETLSKDIRAKVGAFTIHQSFDNPFRYAATIACGSTVGTYRTIRNARRAAKTLNGFSGADWHATDKSQVWRDNQSQRAALDMVRELVFA